MGITDIPETEAAQHLMFAALLQLFMIHVCTSELLPKQSCSMGEITEKGSGKKDLSTDHSDVAITICMHCYNH